MAAADDARRFIAAAERNAEPIRHVLVRLLTRPGVLLEVASGTGQHAAHMARHLPHIIWQPSDLDADLFDSIAAWTREAGNVSPPRRLDVTAADWGVADIASDLVAIFASNLIHIAPWAVCQGLLVGAGRNLPPGGLLIVYGPFFRRGYPPGEGNRRFDAELRHENPAWGVRALEAVAAEAGGHGLAFSEAVEMPANNLVLVFAKTAGGRDDRS
jgi:Protein of unknown function (DUF938)